MNTPMITARYYALSETATMPQSNPVLLTSLVDYDLSNPACQYQLLDETVKAELAGVLEVSPEELRFMRVTVNNSEGDSCLASVVYTVEPTVGERCLCTELTDASWPFLGSLLLIADWSQLTEEALIARQGVAVVPAPGTPLDTEALLAAGAELLAKESEMNNSH